MIILNYFPTHCMIAGFIAVAISTIETPILVINVAIISRGIYSNNNYVAMRCTWRYKGYILWFRQ